MLLPNRWPGPRAFINELLYGSSGDIIELLMPASLDHSALQLLQYAASGNHAAGGKAWGLDDASVFASVGAPASPAPAGWKAVVVWLAPGSLLNANEAAGGLALVHRWALWGRGVGWWWVWGAGSGGKHHASTSRYSPPSTWYCIVQPLQHCTLRLQRGGVRAEDTCDRHRSTPTDT